MPPADVPGPLAALEREICSLGAEFAEVARGTIEGSLQRAMERYVAGHARWFDELDDAASGSFRRAVEEAIRSGAANVAAGLRDPDIWLSPMTLLQGTDVRPEADPEVPGWFTRLVLRIAGGRPRDSITELDDPSNRIWIQILNAADPLDPVLTEFGLSPSVVPDPGGGHFGLQPRTVRELDPDGALRPLWERYKRLYMAYLAARIEEREAQPSRRAVRRWRGGGGAGDA